MSLTPEDIAELERLIATVQELYRRFPEDLRDDKKRYATWMDILNLQQQIDTLLPLDTGPIGA